MTLDQDAVKRVRLQMNELEGWGTTDPDPEYKSVVSLMGTRFYSPQVNVVVPTEHLTFIRVIGYADIPKEYRHLILP